MKQKRTFSFWSKLVLFINIFASVSILISYLSTRIDPETFWIPAFFGIAYPFFLLLNIIFIVFWLLRFRWLFLLSLISIAIGYPYLLQTVAFNRPSPVPAGKEARVLHVMTYNAHSFKKFDQSQNGTVRKEMLDIVRVENPDVICFQEFYTRQKGKYTIRDSILKILKTHYYYCHPDDDNAFESVGIAIFSKYPLSNLNYLPFTQTNSVNGAIYADLTLPGKTVRIFSVHLQSISFGAPDYQYIDEIKNDIKPNLESSRHIGSKLKWAFIKRSEQAKLVAAKIKESPYPVIVAGDFNDTPVSFAFQTVSHNLQDCFQKKGKGFAKTYNGRFPNFQIDYILCDSVFQVLNYRIIKKELSDHYPVRSDLSY